jgi:phytoene dehydrogenase-like protein
VEEERLYIDGCLHWLGGSSPANNFYQVWQELGAVQGRKIIDHEIFLQMKDSSGKTLSVYTDVDRLEKHLLELSPGDAKTIKSLTKAIRKFTKFNPPLTAQMGGSALKMILLMAPYMPAFMKWRKLTVPEFAQRFKDPFLRRTFSSLFNLPDFSMIFMILTLAWMNARAAGYPIGGSLPFSQAIEQRFLKLGTGNGYYLVSSLNNGINRRHNRPTRLTNN